MKEIDIKFRSWHDKSMLYSVLGKSNVAIAIGNWIYQDNLDTKDFILMQYTGMKDKNGKEIYEGDLVKVFHCSDMGTDQRFDLCEVIFETTESTWEISQFIFRTRKELEKLDLNLEGMGWAYAQTEVVGNIYENPELVRNNGGK